MTTRTWRTWCLCGLSLALAGCTADSEVTSTTQRLETTAPTTIAGTAKAGEGTSVAETPAPTAGTDGTETGGSAATSSTDALAERCPSGEYPAFGAFDIASGALEWSTCSPEETYRAVVGASDDVVLVEESGDRGGAVTIALDVDDGSELWRMSTTDGLGRPPGPIASGGVAVLLTDVVGTPFVVGVDIDTGVERWQIDPGVSVIGQTEGIVVVSGAPGRYSSAPPTGPPGGLRGIDRATGEQRWVNDAVVFSDESGVGVARGAAAVIDTTIVVPTGRTSTAVDITTGVVLWSAPQLNHPVASDGVIVGIEPTLSAERGIRAIDATTGEDLWSAPGRESYGDLLAIGDGVIIVTVGDAGERVAYDLTTGAQRWRAPSTSFGEPQLVSGASLVTLWDGGLGAFSTQDGSQIWGLTEPLRSPLMSSVGINDSTVFVAVNSLPWSD